MAGAYGFKTNADIQIQETGGTLLSLQKNDFVVFGNVNMETAIGYIYSFKPMSPQEVKKSEVNARDLEPILKGWQASKAIIGFDSKEEFEESLAAEQKAQTEATAQAEVEQTSKGKSIKMQKEPKRKENIWLCLTVTVLICTGIYLTVKK